MKSAERGISISSDALSLNPWGYENAQAGKERCESWTKEAQAAYDAGYKAGGDRMSVCDHCGALWDQRHEEGHGSVKETTQRLLAKSNHERRQRIAEIQAEAGIRADMSDCNAS